MIQLLHDVDFLVDILLEERLFFNMNFADDFNCVVDISGF